MSDPEQRVHRQLLFVYGTLMEGFNRSWQKTLGAKPIGKGTMVARLYDLGEYPGAVLAPGASDRVEGELYELRAGTGRAHADFNVCNKTKSRVALAFGFRQNGAWMSQGWWNIESGRCQKIMVGKLSETRYYLYANAKVGTWVLNGPFRFCAKNDAFQVQGNGNCETRGYQTLGFREILVGNNSTYTYEIYQPGQ